MSFIHQNAVLQDAPPAHSPPSFAGRSRQQLRPPRRRAGGGRRPPGHFGVRARLGMDGGCADGARLRPRLRNPLLVPLADSCRSQATASQKAAFSAVPPQRKPLARTCRPCRDSAMAASLVPFPLGLLVLEPCHLLRRGQKPSRANGTKLDGWTACILSCT